MERKSIESIEKKKVLDVCANIKVGAVNPSVDGNFIRTEIQSTGGGVVRGQRLFIFDHRATTLDAARHLLEIDDTKWDKWEERRRRERIFLEAFNQPARVVVIEKKADKAFYYINLYPAYGQQPKALFAKTVLTCKHNAGYKIKENKSLWSWESKGSSRTGMHAELVIVSITDDAHRIIIDAHGYANIGHTCLNNIIIDSGIKQMSDEELALGLT